MKVHDNITKVIFFLPYYLIHKNIFLGFFYRKFFSYFKYKNIKIFIKNAPFMISEYSSFVFKTYEFNDRYLIEKYLNKKKQMHYHWSWTRIYSLFMLQIFKKFNKGF